MFVILFVEVWFDVLMAFDANHLGIFLHWLQVDWKHCLKCLCHFPSKQFQWGLAWYFHVEAYRCWFSFPYFLISIWDHWEKSSVTFSCNTIHTIMILSYVLPRMLQKPWPESVSYWSFETSMWNSREITLRYEINYLYPYDTQCSCSLIQKSNWYHWKLPELYHGQVPGEKAT